MENNEEKNKDNSKQETATTDEITRGNWKNWLQDNLRIIISVLIVVLIAGGIYSYSKRSATPANKEVTQKSEHQKDNIKKDENNNTIKEKKQEKKSTTTKKNTAVKKSSIQKTSSITTSQETEQSFIEVAGKGDSQTTLARAALAHYLEKNSDSSLTAEHKIYIEDYLRKAVHHQGRIYIGTSVEFSKNLLKQAIAKSKTLTAHQLKNLHQYAVRVPSLS